MPPTHSISLIQELAADLVAAGLVQSGTTLTSPTGEAPITQLVTHRGRMIVAHIEQTHDNTENLVYSVHQTCNQRQVARLTGGRVPAEAAAECLAELAHDW